MGDWHGSSENSLHAIGKAVDKGAAIVSVYLQKTADDELIMFTDPTLDRMTEGTGPVAAKTLSEIKALKMREYRGLIVDWPVLSLKEGIEATRGKILLRVFADPYLKKVEAIVKESGADHVIVSSEKRPSKGIKWMPVVDLDGKKPLKVIKRVLKAAPVAVELRFAKDDNIFLDDALKVLSGKTRICMSTMKEGLSGSHVDVQRGVDPEPVWGELRKMGATLIQTDELKPLMIYLTGKELGPPSGKRPGGDPVNPGQFVNRTFNEGQASLPYNLYLPVEYDGIKKYPLVVFVHDAGRISNDPTLSATLEGAKAWTTEESQAKNPCIVLAPQFVTNTLGGGKGSLSQQDLTLHLIQSVCKEFSVDEDRIYGTGQSMGCMQTMAMCMTHPDLFAACLLVSGQLDPEQCDALFDKKLWIVVSEDDQRAFPGMNALTDYLKTKGAGVAYASIPAQLSQDAYHHLADSLIACGTNIKYVSLAAGTLPEEELQKFSKGGAVAHMASFDVIYRIDAFREWLFTQKKGEN